MTSALVPFTFNSIKLFTVTINGKHWTHVSLTNAKKTPNVMLKTTLISTIDEVRSTNELGISWP